MLNISRIGSFICFIERELKEVFGEELSQIVRVTVSWRLRRNRGLFYAAEFPMMLGHSQLAAFPDTTASLTFWDPL